MSKINAFLMLFMGAITSLIILAVVSFYLFAADMQYPWDWMWMHMSSMMGGDYQVPYQHPALPYLGFLFIGFVVLALVGVFGVLYVLISPEVKLTKESVRKSTENSTNPYSAVLKVLTPEERKIVEILMAHEGKFLQKYLRKEAGLTRLKTHRILSRLSKRGLVAMRKVGNTNEIVLADWLYKKQISHEDALSGEDFKSIESS